MGGIWEEAGLGLNPGFSILYLPETLSFSILKMGATNPSDKNWDKIQITETIS